MKRQFNFTTILVLLILVGCKGKTAQHIPEITLSTYTVTNTSIPYPMSFVSAVEGYNTYDIQPHASGFVTKIGFDDGMPVKRGQLLFCIDPTTYEADKVEAMAGLASAKAQLTNAQASFKRVSSLVKINAISVSELDNAIATLKSAEQNMLASKGKLTESQVNLGYTKIYSPSNGIASASGPNVGDWVGAGSSYNTLTNINDIDSINVKLSITDKIYKEITSRMGSDNNSYDNSELLSNIKLFLSNGAEYKYEGVYNYTESGINPQTNTIDIYVTFKNPQLTLKPGEFVRVTADIGPSENVVLVPKRCVMQTQNIYSVYVVNSDSTLVYKPITKGRDYQNYYTVEKGLKSGEVIVSDGLFKARNGMKIKTN